jgi:hypothetical protein
VLQKNGFELVGPVTDPEDGLVWRWERSVAGATFPPPRSDDAESRPR